MLDEEALFIGITIGSMEEAFKQAVIGPSPEDKEKVVYFYLHIFWRVIICIFCVSLKSICRWFPVLQ